MFSLTMQTDNDAFSEHEPDEVARILKEIAYKLEGGETNGDCRDINGNAVGAWVLTQ
jgi:hypothetical protein